MNCHELSHSKSLIFWGQKCGATCIKEILMHIETEGTFFDNSGRDDITHKIYERFYKNRPDYALVDKYSTFKIFCFIRNPYHRIISLYLDKYVAVNSPTPEIANQIHTFESFIKYIAKIGFDDAQSKQKIFEGFFPITVNDCYSFFKKITKNNTNVVYFVLEEFLLPDGKLVHRFNDIRTLYEQIDKLSLFNEVYHIINENWEYKKNWIRPVNTKYNIELWNMSIIDLRNFLKTNKVDAECFYSNSLLDIFNSLYTDEIQFYNKIFLLKH